MPRSSRAASAGIMMRSDGSILDIAEVYEALGDFAGVSSWATDVIEDVTASDSDKSFTVPADTEWQPVSVFVEYTSTAAAGDRQLVVEFLDDAGEQVAVAPVTVVQTASETVTYVFALNVGVDFARVYDNLNTTLPLSVLLAGYSIHVYDAAAIAAAADTMVVRLVVQERAA